jgi:hypothetical protein
MSKCKDNYIMLVFEDGELQTVSEWMDKDGISYEIATMIEDSDGDMGYEHLIQQDKMEGIIGSDGTRIVVIKGNVVDLKLSAVVSL